LNSLAAPLYEQGLLSSDREALPTAAGQGFGTRKRIREEELALPITWIGKGYEPPTGAPPSGAAGGGGGGCGAAGSGGHREFHNQPHWRRGHHRMQACGPGRQQRRLIWVEAVRVNGHLA
jgi:hypothetical protein